MSSFQLTHVFRGASLRQRRFWGPFSRVRLTAKSEVGELRQRGSGRVPGMALLVNCGAVDQMKSCIQPEDTWTRVFQRRTLT